MRVPPAFLCLPCREANDRAYKLRYSTKRYYAVKRPAILARRLKRKCKGCGGAMPLNRTFFCDACAAKSRAKSEAAYLKRVRAWRAPQENARIRTKRKNPGYLAAERERNRERMRRARAENPNYGRITAAVAHCPPSAASPA
jgi:hypothetical protein